MTAVHEDQLSWGEHIKHRPVELLSFHQPSANKASKNATGNLRYDGKLLLDFRGEPLRDFSSLPLIISSAVEGWRVEAWMRSDSRMGMTDIVARIPVVSATGPGGHQGHRTLMPIHNAGTFRERARRYRNKAGLISWGLYGKDPKIENFMDELRSPAEKANNQPIDRYLTDLEKSSLQKLNVGTRPDRAQVRQDPHATQRYKDRVYKKADLTWDFDCRAERPETPEEIEEIQKALQHTCRDFASYTSIPLKVPNARDSYPDQWNFMQVQLNKIWANDKTNNEEPPQLFALGKWNISFDNWTSASRAYLTYVRE